MSSKQRFVKEGFRYVVARSARSHHERKQVLLTRVGLGQKGEQQQSIAAAQQSKSLKVEQVRAG